jgi:hypothetical protein
MYYGSNVLLNRSYRYSDEMPKFQPDKNGIKSVTNRPAFVRKITLGVYLNDFYKIISYFFYLSFNVLIQ